MIIHSINGTKFAKNTLLDRTLIIGNYWGNCFYFNLYYKNTGSLCAKSNKLEFIKYISFETDVLFKILFLYNSVSIFI